MKHPIYECFEETKVKNIVKKISKNLNNIKDEDVADVGIKLLSCSFLIDFFSEKFKPIIKSNDDFYSTISENTFRKIDFRNIKIPFSSGVFDSEHFYLFWIDRRGMKSNVKNLEDILDDSFHFVYYDKASKDYDFFTIESQDRYIDFLNNNFFVEFISAIMYTINFKKDVKKVSEPIVYKVKKTKTINNHSVSIIYIKQSVTSRQGYSTERCKSEKMWIVRGHWRQQPYKDEIKPKWIDSYWKGDGKEVVQKVYKV